MPRKRMRLPNGFGQITELKGRRLRNPYRVMITVGKTEEGKPICKLLKPQAYFPTYNDAYKALVEYNANPYDLENDITLSDFYQKWLPGYFSKLKSESSKRTIHSAWNYCKPLYDLRVKEIRVRHIKTCIDGAPTPNIKSRIKSLMNVMLDYAVECEVVDQNYARAFSLSGDITSEKENLRKHHQSFTDEEMHLLWDHVGENMTIDMILYQCYSGWRPTEMLNIKLEDVDLENVIVKGGMKTAAGINRIVPIHPRVYDIVKKYYEMAKIKGCVNLFNDIEGDSIKNISYDKYQYRYKKCTKMILNSNYHRPHDPRKHFITTAKKYGVDEYAIKRMVGHSISDVTEYVYTDRDLNWLKLEITKFC